MMIVNKIPLGIDFFFFYEHKPWKYNADEWGLLFHQWERCVLQSVSNVFLVMVVSVMYPSCWIGNLLFFRFLQYWNIPWCLFLLCNELSPFLFGTANPLSPLSVWPNFFESYITKYWQGWACTSSQPILPEWSRQWLNAAALTGLITPRSNSESWTGRENLRGSFKMANMWLSHR